MKRLFVLLLFLLVPLAPIGAQGLHGKILVFRDSTSFSAAYNFLHLLPSIYSGEVDSESILPSDLDGYDAVFLFPGYRSVAPDTLTHSNALSLISYLRSGGKLYAESGSFLSNNSSTDSLSADTLWHYLGVELELYQQTEVWFDSVYGVDSEFTRGIEVSWVHSDPLQFDSPDVYEAGGSVIPVLYVYEGNDGISDAIGWIPSDTSTHAVLYHPAGEGYNLFFTRVLCDYFGLCVDAVKETPPAIPTVTLRVVNDGFSTSCIISVDETGTLDIANALGITVFHASVNSGTSQIELPETLRNGVYFVRLQTGHGGQVQPFAFVAK